MQGCWSCTNPQKEWSTAKGNHRPVTILTSLSMVIEISINNPLTTFTNIILDDRISAYRKGYSCQYALLKFVEEWRKTLDNQEVPAALLMDLSKAFDAMPPDILVAKLYAYGMSQETVTLLASYLRNQKQRVKVRNCESDCEPLSKGVPQGFIMGPILFNVFLNDIVLFIKKSSLTNYADDNTIIGKHPTGGDQSFKWRKWSLSRMVVQKWNASQSHSISVNDEWSQKNKIRAWTHFHTTKYNIRKWRLSQIIWN